MTESITSLQNARVKDAVKLRDRKGRQSQGRTIIDGVREISRAIESEVEIVELFCCERLLTDFGRHVVTRAADHQITTTSVTPPVFEKLAYGDRGDGLVAVATTPTQSLDDLRLADDAIIAVLDQVEKPGNVGAVLRTADATGTSAVIVTDAATDLYNPNAIRASLGSIFTVPVVSATSEETQAWLRHHQFHVLAARVEGSVNYTQASYAGRTAVVLGSESCGLSDAWTADDVQAISLPMRGLIDSLNVSVAAAVLMYEGLRQRST